MQTHPGSEFQATNQGVEYMALDCGDQARILQLQQDILRLVALGYDAVEVCRQICLLEEQLLPNAVASVMLLDDEGQRLHVFAAPSVPVEGVAQLNGLRPGPGAGSCGNAVFRREPVFVENTHTDPRWEDLRQLACNFNIGACWSMPIRGKGGRVIGSFALSSFEHRLPSPFHHKLLEIGAFIVGIVLEQRRANEQLHLAGKVFEYSTEGIMITDAGNRIVSVNRAFTRITGYALDQVKGKNPSLLSAGRHGPAFYQKMWQSLAANGYWQGEIWNKARDGRVYPEWLSITAINGGDGKLGHYLGIFSDLSDKKRSDEIIWRQANYDALTGLPNRNRFYDRLEQAIKAALHNGGRLALLLIDLDHFKEVNDTVGHAYGDALLKAAGERLQACAGQNSVLARLGGDEFTLILPDIADNACVEQTAQTFLDTLAAPFVLDGAASYLSASIGIALFPDDAVGIDALLKYADQAMYAAKNQGRNAWRYFTPALQIAAEHRSRTSSDLREALVRDQFHLVYQPIVELATGRIRKAEALIRWQHPQRGFISPAEFIPLAEETRLIREIGGWVFERAVEQVAAWQAAYGADFQISVNKSPLQFKGDEDWVGYLVGLGLSGHSIVVEITEGLLLDADEQVSNKLLAFRDAGIQVAIDDFGTGYSSLSYLKKFDIDYLKIDQSFVRNLAPDSSDLVLCEAIVTMAHRLGMQVIAEGVETREQRDLLSAAGCDFAQGYWFAKPLSVADFETMLAKVG
ncbi:MULTISPECIES: putative bifunctional diguanylate cyclase/phosphodiesterase [Methylomonas]|uniref:Diguanylate cyclase n=1 Tax=Methylomonas koyamae TaxID=702114 RepID=A0A177N942_9GAMM|nr:EAL domain-containing protein [Methylomonas koyamae]OAI14457.1 diguanylate cyclase [Methylomonas koyamae]